MLILPGSNALSAFRARRLLATLQEIDPAITGVDARYLHFVDGGEGLSQNALARLSSLLSYGDPYSGNEAGDEYVVVPRFGTISPWSSKATDIAHFYPNAALCLSLKKPRIFADVACTFLF